MVLAVFMVGCTTVVPETDLSEKGPNGQAGNSNIAHLYLYEKENFETDGWDVVNKGAWGKMKYNLSGEMFEFVFNGHGLEAGFEYKLIYYPDPWPGNGLICLGSGVANKGGNVHIAESVNTGDLPACGDENVGAKIWLVLSSDVDCDAQEMIGWNPAEYLFEYDLIEFEDIDTDWLCLYEKTPGPLTTPPTPWEIVEDGAWGKMKYNLSGSTFDFVFNGHGLEAGGDYTLIYYPDPWPGNGLICLGEGTANPEGDVHIASSVDTGDLPIDTDENDGAKIWLVLSDDVDCGNKMIGWSPTEYLFEGDVIEFDDTSL